MDPIRPTLSTPGSLPAGAPAAREAEPSLSSRLADSFTSGVSSLLGTDLAYKASSRKHCPVPDDDDGSCGSPGRRGDGSGPDDVPDEFPSRDNRGGPDDTSDPDFGGRGGSDDYYGPDGGYNFGPYCP